MKKPARAAPAPVTPIAQRLEHVRVRAGFVSLRSFWEHVTTGWVHEGGEPATVSYEAVRNYHYDREPSVAYLTRVADLFGYRLQWLAEGIEPSTETETAVLKARKEHTAASARRVLKGLGYRGKFIGTPYWTLAAVEAARRLALSYPKGTENGLALAEEAIGRTLRLPLESLGINPNSLHPQDVGLYILGMLPVLLPLTDYKRSTTSDEKE